jgi:drug/metabolite transporter (DMT)-like permease
MAMGSLPYVPILTRPRLPWLWTRPVGSRCPLCGQLPRHLPRRRGLDRVSAMRRAGQVIWNDSLLLLTALIWGMAFVAQRVGMEHVGPFTYNAVRFALGSLSLVPLILIRDARVRPRGASLPSPQVRGLREMSPLRAGLIAGGVLVFGASLQQIGLVYTTAGKAGFITGLYVVLVPLVGLFFRQRAGWSAWTGAVLAVMGLFLLSMTETFAIHRGDLLVLIGAFFWTAHVQVIGWLSPRTDPVKLSCVQFAVCALASAAGALLTEHPGLPSILAAAWPILYGGVLSVGVAYTLQVVAQGKAPPAHAAILMSLESVFAALGGGWILGETLGAREAAGCAVMLAGMLVSQAPLVFGSLVPKRRRG